MNYKHLTLSAILLITGEAYSMEHDNISDEQKKQTKDELGLELAKAMNFISLDRQNISPETLERITNLINSGANLDLVDPNDKYGSTPLINACFMGLKDIAILLIKSGANINFQNSHDEMPLTMCFQFIKDDLESKMEIAKELITSGADVNLGPDHKETPLTLCCNLKAEREDIINLLIKYKANIDHQNEYKITALIRAAIMGHKKISKLLIDNGANINIQDRKKETALMKASINNDKEIVELLLDNDADIYLKRINKDNTIDIAKRNYLYDPNKEKKEIYDLLLRQDDLIERLIKAVETKDIKLIKLIVYKHPNLVDKNGDNALQISYKSNNFDMVKLIVKVKLNLLNKKNREGKTPLDENPEIILHLILSGFINPK